VQEDTTARLGELLADRFAANEPGAAIGVYRNGSYAGGAVRGLASLEYALAIGEDTVFDIASCSKQLTATCALLLARDGLVDLDSDVREVVPELQIPGVTLRGCLQHTTGLRDYMQLNDLAGGTLADLATTADFLRLLGRMTSTGFAPGADVAYSNTGYVLASVVAARAAGAPFTEVLTDRVLAPLGMHRTRLHDRVGLVVPGMAFSYSPSPSGRFTRHEMIEEQVGDGAVLTTVRELAGWQGFLLDGRVLGADVRAELVRPATLADGRTTSYGCGVARADLFGTAALSHSGGMYGYRSELVCLPSLALGVAVLSNRGDADAQALAHAALAVLLDRPSAEPSPPAPDGAWFAPARVDHLRVVDGALPDSHGGVATRDGDGMLLQDLMGGLTRYHRLDAGAGPAPGALAGRYRPGEPPGDVVIRLGAAGPEVCLGGAPARPLTYAGQHAGLDVYDAGGWTVVAAREDGPVDAIALRADGCCFPRLPRVAD
jgi:CubicO group peptidase (beta-lactamase class C family)